MHFLKCFKNISFVKFGFKILLDFRLLIFIIIFFGSLTSVSSQAASPSMQLNIPKQQEYLNLINELRGQVNLKPLNYNDKLTASASSKAFDMQIYNYWGHKSPSGINFGDFIWRESPKSERVGENLARCFETSDSTFDALKNSQSHYDVMIGDFTDFGMVELFNDKDNCNYAVFHFSKNL